MAETEAEGNGADGKRNRSLEALFQVTHSELQNFSRQHPPPDTSSAVVTSNDEADISATKEDKAEVSTAVAMTEEVIIVAAGEDIVGDVHVSEAAAEETVEGGSEPSGEGKTHQVVRLPVSEKGIEKYQLKSSTLEEQGFKLTYTKQTYNQYEPNPISYGSYRPKSFKPMTLTTGSTEVLSPVSTATVAAIVTSTPVEISPQQITMTAIQTSPEAVTTGRKRKHPQKPGRHICPYCGRGCAKPSVLQKHIRAHTGERPYPCIPCGFSFKTKSNLYKHCKSRAHAIKAGLTPNLEDAQKVEQEGNEEEEIMESDESDVESDAEVHDSGELSGNSELKRKRVKREKDLHDHVKKERRLTDRKSSVDSPLLAPREIRPKAEVPSPQIQHMEGKTVIHFTLPEGHKLILNEKQDVILESVNADGQIQQDILGQQALVMGSGDEENKDATAANVSLSVNASAKVYMTDRQYYDVAYVGDGKTPTGSESTLNIHTSDEAKSNSDQIDEVSVVDGSSVVEIQGIMGESSISTLPSSVMNTVTVSTMKDTMTLPEESEVVSIRTTPSSSTVCGPPKLKLHIPSKSSQSIYRKHSTPSTPASSFIPPITAALPADRSAVTPEMLERRISQVISANAAIIDTPMADAPRPKRLSRQNSEVSRMDPTITASKIPKHLDIHSASISSLPSSAGLTPLTPKLVTISEVNDQYKVKLVDSSKLSQQHFLGLAEPSDRPPGIPSPNTLQQSLMKVSNLSKITPTSIAPNQKVVESAVDPNAPSSTITQVTSTPQEIKIQIKLPKPAVNTTQQAIDSPEIQSSPPTSNVLLQNQFLPKNKGLKSPQNPEGSVIKDLLLKGRGKSFPSINTTMIRGMVPTENLVMIQTPRLSQQGEVSEPVMLENELGEVVFLTQDNLTSQQVNAQSQETEVTIEDDEVFIPMYANNKMQKDPAHLSSTTEKEVVIDTVNTPIHVEYLEKQNSENPKNWVVGPHGDVVPVNIENVQVSDTPQSISSKIAGVQNMTAKTSDTAGVFNITDQLTPRKKGRPKGSKNKPKEPITVEIPAYQTNHSSPSIHENAIAIPGGLLFAKSPHLIPNAVPGIASGMIAPLLMTPMVQSPHIQHTQFPFHQRSITPATELASVSPSLSRQPVALSLLEQSAKSSVIQTPMLTSSICSTVTLQGSPLSSTTIQPSLAENRSNPSTPDANTSSQEKSEALWKLKLKGKLLMKRSMSVERSLSIEKQQQESKVSGAVNLMSGSGANSSISPAGLHKRQRYQSLSEALSGKPVISTRAGSEPLLLSGVGLKAGKDINTSTAPVLEHGQGSNVSSLDSEVLPLKKRKLESVTDSSGVVKYVSRRKDNQASLLSRQVEGVRSLVKGGIHKYNSKVIVNQDHSLPRNSPMIYSPHIPTNAQVLRLPLLVEFKFQENLLSELESEESESGRSKIQKKSHTEIFAKQSSVQLKGTKTTFEKYPVDVLLQGHERLVINHRLHTTFCCISRLQPMYVEQGTNKKISMYSNWRVAAYNPNPAGFTTKSLLSFYQSRLYNANPFYVICSKTILKKGIPTHSSYWNHKKEEKESETVATPTEKIPILPNLPLINKQVSKGETEVTLVKIPEKEAPQVLVSHVGAEVDVTETQTKPTQPVAIAPKASVPKRIKLFKGGYKSNEDYIYVRGRGRGKYICEECGIRCKKPSMLKKHIRTHTDLRPYQCKYCHFSFKTKGNLTKHMKSKAHHKKCVELGVNPIPTTVDESQIDAQALARQTLLSKQSKIKGADYYEEHQFSDEEDEDEDENEEEDEEEEEMDEEEEGGMMMGTEAGAEDAAATGSIVSGNDDKELGQGPTYIAIQHPDSSQPTIARICSDGKFVIEGNPHTLSTIYGLSGTNLHEVMAGQMDKDGSLTCRPAIDDEVAHSLLDLSKNVAAANSEGENDGSCSDSQKAQRLQSLIGALINRTEEDGIKVHIVSSDSIRAIESKKEQTGKHFADMTPHETSSTQQEKPEDDDEVWVVMSDSGPILVTQSQMKNIEESPTKKRSFSSSSDTSPQTVTVSETHVTSRKGSISRYAEKIAALQSKNESDLRMMTKRPSKLATGFVPPVLNQRMVPQSGNARTNDSTVQRSFEGQSSSVVSNMDYKEKGSIRSDSLPTQQPLVVSVATPTKVISDLNLGDKSRSKDIRMKKLSVSVDGETSSEVSKDSLSTAELAANLKLRENRHSIGSNSSSEGVPFEQRSPTNQMSPELSTSSPPEKRTASSLSPGGSTVQYITNDNRAPFEIMPIPGRVNDNSDALVDGKYVCSVCQKTFSKQHQLTLHKNIHYFERPFKCEDCGISFRIKGHLIKHQRSESHTAKQTLNVHFGTPSTDNPRPFKCEDCKIAFRIHGHLAKHLRSKMHITTLEKLEKIPIGTYAQIEKNDLTEIDATDCETSLESIQHMIEQESNAASGKNRPSTQRQQNMANELEERRPLTPRTSEDSAGVQNTDSSRTSPTVITADMNAPDITTNKNIESESPHFRMNKIVGEYERDASASNERVTVEIKAELIEFGQIKPLTRYGGDEEEEEYADADGDHFSDDEEIGLQSKVADVEVDNPVSVSCASAAVEKLSGSTNEENCPHKCGICSRTFKSVSLLKQHLVTHAELRPYVCEYCDAGFTTAKSLKFHLRTHSEAHPYICGKCGDNFARSELLRQHMRTHSRRGHHESFSEGSNLDSSDSEKEFVSEKAIRKKMTKMAKGSSVDSAATGNVVSATSIPNIADNTESQQPTPSTDNGSLQRPLTKPKAGTDCSDFLPVDGDTSAITNRKPKLQRSSRIDQELADPVTVTTSASEDSLSLSLVKDALIPTMINETVAPPDVQNTEAQEPCGSDGQVVCSDMTAEPVQHVDLDTGAARFVNESAENSSHTVNNLNQKQDYKD